MGFSIRSKEGSQQYFLFNKLSSSLKKPQFWLGFRLMVSWERGGGIKNYLDQNMVVKGLFKCSFNLNERVKIREMLVN